MKDTLADLKPPLEVPINWMFWFYVILVLMVLVLIVVFIWFWKRKRKAPESKPEFIFKSKDPYEKAQIAFELLLAKDYPKVGLYKLFIDGVTDILRQFVEERFGLAAMHLSTQELCQVMVNAPGMSAAMKSRLEEMMVLADLVKFAQHQISREECQSFLKLAQQIIEESREI